MNTDSKTFECAWCKHAGLEPEEYTQPVAEFGETINGEDVCRDCVAQVDDEDDYNDPDAWIDEDDEDWETDYDD